MPATTGATRHSSRSLIASIAPTIVPSATLAPQCEHMFSALPLRADIAEQSRHVRFVPKSDLASITGRSELFLPSTPSRIQILGSAPAGADRQFPSWFVI